MHEVEAIVFDVFGTLVKIGVKHRPYLGLQRLLKTMGRPCKADDSIKIMSSNVGFSGIPALLGMDLPGSLIAQLEQDLYAEILTVQLYDETLATLESLKCAGYKLALCSNLAAPYAIPVKLLLPPLDAYAWSFEVGAVKPDPRIYDHVCSTLGCAPVNVLMVGDTLEADYHGPRRFGMRSYHLSRDGARFVDHSITSLDNILDLLDDQQHQPSI